MFYYTKDGKALSPKKKGEKTEEIALEILESLGYKILARNYFFKRAFEADIIALDENFLVAVEVKRLSKAEVSGNFFLEEISKKINFRKLYKIEKSLSLFAKEKKMYNYNMRVDALFVFSRESFRLFKNLEY